MKRMLSVLIALMLVASMTYAGTPMTAQGDRALSFLMEGFGDFGIHGLAAGSAGPYSMYGFGGRYFISENTEIRAGVAFNSRSTTTKTTSGDFKNNLTQIGLAPAILWHCPAAGAVSPYWGFEGQFGWAKDTDTPPSPGVESSDSYTSFGLAGVLGAEWFPWDGVSFNAEYNLGFRSSTSKSESGGTSVDGPTVTEIGIGSWAVGINVFLGR